MAYRLFCYLLFFSLLSSCTEEEVLFLPEIPDQSITLETADGTTQHFTLLQSGANLSELRYRFEPGGTSPPAELFFSRQQTARGPSIYLSGDWPLPATAFTTEGVLSREALSFPQEISLDAQVRSGAATCTWPVTARIESWGSDGVLRGTFTSTVQTSCPAIGGGAVIAGAFAVYVAAIRYN